LHSAQLAWHHAETPALQTSWFQVALSQLCTTVINFKVYLVELRNCSNAKQMRSCHCCKFSFMCRAVLGIDTPALQAQGNLQ